MKNKLIEIDRKREEETLNYFNLMKDDLTEYVDHELSKHTTVMFDLGLGLGLCSEFLKLGINTEYEGCLLLKSNQKDRLDHMLKNHLKKHGYHVSRNPTSDTRVMRKTELNKLLLIGVIYAVLLSITLWVLS